MTLALTLTRDCVRTQSLALTHARAHTQSLAHTLKHILTLEIVLDPLVLICMSTLIFAVSHMPRH
jgi:hypothetical protein